MPDEYALTGTVVESNGFSWHGKKFVERGITRYQLGIENAVHIHGGGCGPRLPGKIICSEKDGAMWSVDQALLFLRHDVSMLISKETKDLAILLLDVCPLSRIGFLKDCFVRLPCRVGQGFLYECTQHITGEF